MLKENDCSQLLSSAMRIAFYKHLISIISYLPSTLLWDINAVASKRLLPRPQIGSWAGDQTPLSIRTTPAAMHANSLTYGCDIRSGRKNGK